MKKFLTILIACCVIFTAVPARAASDIDTYIDGILSYQMQSSGAEDLQSWVDDVLSAEAGHGDEWYILGLRHYAGEELSFSAYRASLEAYLSSKDIPNPSRRELDALTLLAVGSDSNYVDDIIDRSIDQKGVMGWVYGLHLLLSGGPSSAHTVESAAKQLLSMQLADGGWAVIGENGDVDVTAMTMQALASCGVEGCAEALDRGLDFLSAKQLPSGGFMTMDIENPESASQVLIALSYMGIDAAEDERFIKDGHTLFDSMLAFRNDDGSFSHRLGEPSNDSATRQVFYALVSYSVMDRGGMLYRVDTMPPLAAEHARLSGKALLYTGICAAAAAACVITFLRGRRRIKYYIPIFAIAAVALLAVRFISISSVDKYYDKDTAVSGDTVTTTISVRCDTVAGRADHIPADGVILDTVSITLPAGSTAYDQLVEALRQAQIQFENDGSAASAYISGINYLYEFDYGDLSGWMYQVNGEFADVGCSGYVLQEGDAVMWQYTCSMGKDIGAE